MIARRCHKQLPEVAAHEAKVSRAGLVAAAPYGAQEFPALARPRAEALRRSGAQVDLLAAKQAEALAAKGPRCPKLEVPPDVSRWWDHVRFGGWGEPIPSTLDPLDEPRRVHEAALTISAARSRAAAQARAAAKAPKEADGGV